MESSSSVWLCPACGRHVPPRRDTCHCGAARPAPPSSRDPRRAAPARRLRSLAALLLLAGIGALLYYGWPQAWYGAWTERVSLVTSTPAPTYPGVPDAGPEEADLSPLPPAVGRPAAPLPAPEVAERSPSPAARAVATASGQGVPALPDSGGGALDEPGPLGAAERRAITALTPRVVALDGLAEKVDGQMRRYMKACRQQTVLPAATSARRDWPVALLLDPAIAPTSEERSSMVSTGCLALWEELRGEADQLASALEDMQHLARSRGLLPGHVRAALAEHRLDDWERYLAR